MAKRDPVEDKLQQLAELRRQDDRQLVLTELSKALEQKRSGLIAAKAADLTAELDSGDLGPRLVPKMEAAFDRLMVQPVKKDKGCLGKTAIARALVKLEAPAHGVFSRGLRHVQMEPTWGGSVDTASELRGHCALGLVRSRRPNAVLEVAELLADAERPTRVAAAEALGDSGDIAAEAVLRLKVSTGDEEPEVSAECFQSLLRLHAQRSLEFVARFLNHSDAATAESAALALGESRMEEAVPLIVRALDLTLNDEVQRSLYLALALTRREPALERLVEEVENGPIGRSRGALLALALHRHDQQLHRRLEELVDERRDRELATIWRDRFCD